MHHEHFEPIPQFARVAASHTLQLLRDRRQVDLVPFTVPQQGRGGQAPAIEVLLVQFSVCGHDFSPAVCISTFILLMPVPRAAVLPLRQYRSGGSHTPPDGRDTYTPPWPAKIPRRSYHTPAPFLAV